MFLGSDPTIYENILYNIYMARRLRIDVGGEFYHCLNRGVGKRKLFFKPADYQLFEQTLQQLVEITKIRLLAYVLMPNHFHLVLHTRKDGDLSDFMKRLTMIHTQTYRFMTDTIGQGPIYQGRYKSFIIQDENYLRNVLRYVERNPLSANLVKDPLQWKYSSLYRRYRGTTKQNRFLTEWTFKEPENYLELIKEPLSNKEFERIKIAELKDLPYGDFNCTGVRPHKKEISVV